jgi:hypothetical protein
MRVGLVMFAMCLALAGCGADGNADRFDLVTPGANTGSPLTSLPEASATPDPSATPEPERKPVTAAERRVIKGWADTLRRGRVAAAARYFTVPALVSNNTPGVAVLRTRADVEEFNATLPCGARLLRTRRGSDGFVVGIFELTDREGAHGQCGTGVGEQAAVAFKVQDGHISEWVRVDAAPGGGGGGGEAPEPVPTPPADAAPAPGQSS